MGGFISMLDDYMVRYRDKRIKTESGHGHHGPARDAESCGMIGGDGINGESNKTAPAPKHHKSSYRPQHPFTSYLDNPAGPHRQGTDTMERALEARAQRLCHHLRRPLAKRGNTTMKTPVTHLTRQAHEYSSVSAKKNSKWRFCSRNLCTQAASVQRFLENKDYFEKLLRRKFIGMYVT